jgi:hypothetical protein
MLNGLPQVAVQDLAIWVDPTGGPGAMRLLRAATQARGVWEMDIHAGCRRGAPNFPAGTRVRRPAAIAGTIGGSAASAHNPAVRVADLASPDIMVRPLRNPSQAPAWRLGAAGRMTGTNATAARYQLWTFQTAFR